jgi:hypothetical protein
VVCSAPETGECVAQGSVDGPVSALPEDAGEAVGRAVGRSDQERSNTESFHSVASGHGIRDNPVSRTHPGNWPPLGDSVHRPPAVRLRAPFALPTRSSSFGPGVLHSRKACTSEGEPTYRDGSSVAIGRNATSADEKGDDVDDRQHRCRNSQDRNRNRDRACSGGRHNYEYGSLSHDSRNNEL